MIDWQLVGLLFVTSLLAGFVGSLLGILFYCGLLRHIVSQGINDMRAVDRVVTRARRV